MVCRLVKDGGFLRGFGDQRRLFPARGGRSQDLVEMARNRRRRVRCHRGHRVSLEIGRRKEEVGVGVVMCLGVKRLVLMRLMMKWH